MTSKRGVRSFILVPSMILMALMIAIVSVTLSRKSTSNSTDFRPERSASPHGSVGDRTHDNGASTRNRIESHPFSDPATVTSVSAVLLTHPVMILGAKCHIPSGTNATIEAKGHTRISAPVTISGHVEFPLALPIHGDTIVTIGVLGFRPAEIRLEGEGRIDLGEVVLVGDARLRPLLPPAVAGRRAFEVFVVRMERGDSPPTIAKALLRSAEPETIAVPSGVPLLVAVHGSSPAVQVVGFQTAVPPLTPGELRLVEFATVDARCLEIEVAGIPHCARAELGVAFASGSASGTLLTDPDGSGLIVGLADTKLRLTLVQGRFRVPLRQQGSTDEELSVEGIREVVVEPSIPVAAFSPGPRARNRYAFALGSADNELLLDRGSWQILRAADRVRDDWWLQHENGQVDPLGRPQWEMVEDGAFRLAGSGPGARLTVKWTVPPSPTLRFILLPTKEEDGARRVRADRAGLAELRRGQESVFEDLLPGEYAVWCRQQGGARGVTIPVVERITVGTTDVTTVSVPPDAVEVRVRIVDWERIPERLRPVTATILGEPARVQDGLFSTLGPSSGQPLEAVAMVRNLGPVRLPVERCADGPWKARFPLERFTRSVRVPLERLRHGEISVDREPVEALAAAEPKTGYGSRVGTAATEVVVDCGPGESIGVVVFELPPVVGVLRPELIGWKLVLDDDRIIGTEFGVVERQIVVGPTWQRDRVDVVVLAPDIGRWTPAPRRVASLLRGESTFVRLPKAAKSVEFRAGSRVERLSILDFGASREPLNLR